MARIIAVLSDLFFEAKIRSAAEHLHSDLRIIKDREGLFAELEKGVAKKVIFDLNFSNIDPIGTAAEIRGRYEVELIGYLSHVQIDLKRLALQHFDKVLARSEFSERLPEFLSA